MDTGGRLVAEDGREVSHPGDADAPAPPSGAGPPDGKAYALDLRCTVTLDNLRAYVAETERSKLICFRCGEHGHVRAQCLTYRVRMCWHQRAGMCAATHCTFAHDESELRTPWAIRCVRVVKQNGTFICIGCNSTEHTFRHCPLHRDYVV